MSRWIGMFLLAGSLAVLGCDSKSANQPLGKLTPADVRRDAGEAAKSAGESLSHTKAEFEKQLETRLAELDVEMAKLRKQGGELKNEAKANWEKMLPELEAKHEAARGRLAELRKSSAEAWKEVQKGAQSAWDDLDKAFRNATSKF